MNVRTRLFVASLFVARLFVTGLLVGLLSAAAVAQETSTPDSAAPQPSDPKPSEAEPAAPPAGTVFFVDVTKDAGITFEHQSAPEKKYILESMSGGVALLDFDGDDRLDIYFVNSLTVDTAYEPKTAPSALYRNLGNGRYEEVAVKAGVAYPGWGVGVCAADVDGDGHGDLYVTGVGRNAMYRNRGDGTFEDVTADWGVGAEGWSAGCGFADYDRDGDLDLFVSRYVEVSLDNLPEFGKGKSCLFRGVAVQCGPRGLPGTPDLLFRNDGAGDGGRFTEVGKAAGVDDPDGYFGLGVAFFDADQDGWLDLFVANDATPNFLYMNQKDGTFVEDAFPMGVAVSEDGAEQGGMGVAVGDLENRGLFDLFVANFAEEYNAVFRNENGFFNDVSFRSGTGGASLPYVGWGSVFFDADNDADLDLIVVNGHVYPQLDQAKLGASAPYRQRKLFYLGDGKGGFEEVGERYGEAFTELRVSRGLAAGDLDEDGRLDLVINDLDGAPQVLMNRYQGPEGRRGHWLLVELEGDGKNPDAIGATVAVTTGTGDKAVTQTRLVQSGASYLSQHSLRQHFGLGDAAKVETIVVTWPDGSTTTRTGVEADQRIVVSKSPAP